MQTAIDFVEIGEDGLIVRPAMATPVALDRLLNYRQTALAIGFSKATIYRMMRRGEFPRRYLVGGRARWSARDVLAWQTQQRETTSPDAPTAPAETKSETS